MFHPVGSQPPNIYWRRRLLVVGSAVIVLVLIVITFTALTSGGSGAPAGGDPRADGASHTPTATHPSAPKPSPSTTAGSHTSSHASRRPSKHPTASGSGTATGSGTTAASKTCRTSDLQIAAVVGHDTYAPGQDPQLEMQVTNVGTAPCVQNFGDEQIVLRVYNGVSRVWGSHDCAVQPGTGDRTLAVGAPVIASIAWSGYTSQPNCAGSRQRVGAGTYTLYASLSGKTGKAAQFTIS